VSPAVRLTEVAVRDHNERVNHRFVVIVVRENNNDYVIVRAEGRVLIVRRTCCAPDRDPIAPRIVHP
jgi:hypothetical protein